MKYYLGIDGGGTKTKFLLADENLRIVAEHTGSSCYYLACGFDGLTKLIDEGIETVCKTAGINRSEIVSAFAGLSGYDDSKSVNAPITEAVAAGMNGIPFGVANDSENALAGALGGEPGINIIAGTGSIAAGRNAAGDVAKCGGGLHVIGTDEGSAYWIAIRLMHEFTKQDDGRHERTLLYDKIKEVLHIEDKQDMISHVVDNWKLERDKMSSLAPLCAELYDAGEPTAIRIINQVVDEFAEMAIAIYRRLNFAESQDTISIASQNMIPVSGTGGVFKMGERITAPLNKILNKNNMKFVEPLYDPAFGALILARNTARE